MDENFPLVFFTEGFYPQSLIDLSINSRICRAIEKDDLDMFRSIYCGLDEKRDIYILPSNGVTHTMSLMEYAAYHGSNGIIKYLIQTGNDVNAFHSASVKRPIHLACERGHSATVSVLLEASAEVHFGERNGITPLMYACMRGDEEIIKMILKHSLITILALDRLGNSALCYAAENSHVKSIMEMIGSFTKHESIWMHALDQTIHCLIAKDAGAHPISLIFLACLAKKSKNSCHYIKCVLENFPQPHPSIVPQVFADISLKNICRFHLWDRFSTSELRTFLEKAKLHSHLRSYIDAFV